MRRPPPIHYLPDGYREALHLVAMEAQTLARLNTLGFGVMAVALGLMIGWVVVADGLRLSIVPGDFVPPVWLGWLLVVGVLPLHELFHGLAIRYMGHKPRYGVVTVPVNRFIKLPLALYATTDQAYFPRNAFITVALAPLVMITVGGMLLILLLPEAWNLPLVVAVIINAGGAIGDLWMTAAVLRYPPDSLVRDEADSIRVFTREGFASQG